MRRYFLDTFYLIALSDPRESWHKRALSFSQSTRHDQFYTVEEVLVEYLTFFSKSHAQARKQAVLTVRDMFIDSRITVFPQTHASFLDGLVLYEARPDKGYSLTDCVSMQAMRREGLKEILTNDRHFEQEGFHVLFSGSSSEG